MTFTFCVWQGWVPVVTSRPADAVVVGDQQLSLQLQQQQPQLKDDEDAAAEGFCQNIQTRPLIPIIVLSAGQDLATASDLTHVLRWGEGVGGGIEEG